MARRKASEEGNEVAEAAAEVAKARKPREKKTIGVQYQQADGTWVDLLEEDDFAVTAKDEADAKAILRKRGVEGKYRTVRYGPAVTIKLKQVAEVTVE